MSAIVVRVTPWARIFHVACWVGGRSSLQHLDMLPGWRGMIQMDHEKGAHLTNQFSGHASLGSSAGRQDGPRWANHPGSLILITSVHAAAKLR
jgi:hypothetical protein